MHVAIPPEFEQFVETVIGSGAYHSPREVVGDALRLLERREKLRHDVQAGVEQLDRGAYIEYDENSLEQFLEDVRQEERRLFPHENSAP